LSVFWQKNIENLGSLRESELLVQVVQGFDRKRDCRVAFLDLWHVVNGFGGNCEQCFAKGGSDGPLAEQIMSLAFQSEFGKVVGLREHIQRQIGLPESNFVALIQEDIF
jgi:hypothetical protein